MRGDLACYGAAGGCVDRPQQRQRGQGPTGAPRTLHDIEPTSIDIYTVAEDEDLGSHFEPFTSGDLRVLELYDRLCGELGESTFFNAKVMFRFGPGTELIHAGFDALRSMAMSFRQLWLQKEPAQFHRVLRVLREHAKPASGAFDIVVVLDGLGRRYKAARREVLMKHVWEGDPFGEAKETFDAERVINDWLNSGLFHTDNEAVARVTSWSPTAYEFSVIKALHHVTGVMWELHLVVVAALANTEPENAAVA